MGYLLGSEGKMETKNHSHQQDNSGIFFTEKRQYDEQHVWHEGEN